VPFFLNFTVSLADLPGASLWVFQAIFAASGCASCHTLAAAGAAGTAGPNLDQVKPTQSIVRAFVQNGATDGGVTMPAFTNLSQTDLNNIAAYIYASTHH
jgi:mono/diheme cytochrome c family protein